MNTPDPRGPLDTCLLAVTDRRRFLRLGGSALITTALLAACGTGGGDEEATPSTTTEPKGPEPSPELDLVLANTAISLEVLVIDAYQRALDSGLVASDPMAVAMRRFQGHHGEHRDALVALVEGAGAVPYTTPNAVLRAGFVDPQLLSAATEGDLVRVVYDLERSAALSYVHAATQLSSAALRQTAVSIGSVEARHAALLEVAGELRNDKPAFAPTDDPLPSDARIPG